MHSRYLLGICTGVPSTTLLRGVGVLTKKNMIGAWILRAVLFGMIIAQNSEVVATARRYLINLNDVESAVQASQLSGELILVAITELSSLLVYIVFWVMVELTIKEVFTNKKAKSTEIVVEGVYTK